MLGQRMRVSESAMRSPRGALRVLLTTEGTYPYAVGGVSSWCDTIIRGLPEIDWWVLPVTAASRFSQPAFELPTHAALAGVIDLWSREAPPQRPRPGPLRSTVELPGRLARAFLSPESGPQTLVEGLVSCRRDPGSVRAAFRSGRSWRVFMSVLRELAGERPAGASPSAAPLDALDAATLYQTLYWVARAAARPAPPVDLLHVTAAGWASIPALVHKALHGTPLLLTEHGVYVREAYLAHARARSTPGVRFLGTRVAQALARAAYSAADLVAPVTDANAVWERRLGVDPGKIRVIYNGVEPGGLPSAPPRTSTVVSVGRIDPLKDLYTMLRVAAEVVSRLPDVRFVHYGPVAEGEEAYGRSCRALHAELGLGDSFRFLGPTDHPDEVVRASDLVLMTSISEGLPLAVLDALAVGRPVVATGVGGVRDVVRGCGIVAPPGDVPALADAVCALLGNPELAWRLGRRGFARVRRRFTRDACLSGYRAVVSELAGHSP